MKPAVPVAFALCAACGLPVRAQVQATPDRLGDTLKYVVPLGAAVLSLLHEDTSGLGELGGTLLLSQGTTEVLKHVVDSPRPDGSGQGFPSGHTSVVFASAGYVRQRYGWQEATPFYVAATVTAWSRVHTHHHFTKDVVGGAVIGEGSAILVARWMGPRQSASVGYASGGAWVRYAQSF